MRRKPEPIARYESGLPTERSNPHPAHDPSGRRRFLKQLAIGAGAVGFGSVPRLGHGQSAAVDFSVLTNHPVNEPPEPPVVSVPTTALVGPPPSLPSPGPVPPARVPAPAPPAEAPAQAPAATEPPAAEPDEVAEGAPPEPPEPYDLAADSPPSPRPLESVLITENRALWLDPGYLVLLRWVRAEGDDAVVAALERTSDEVAAFLHDRVHSVDDLHDVGRLHAIEGEVFALLMARLPTATIEVLHLDHDCSHVCSMLEPGTLPSVRPEIPVPGGI